MFFDPRDNELALYLFCVICVAFGWGLGEVLIQLDIVKPRNLCDWLQLIGGSLGLR